MELFHETLTRDIENSDHPNKKSNLIGMNQILNRIKNNFLLTKFNSQLNELENWVFEMVPELVMVYPNSHKMDNFNHFEDKNGLFTFITKYIKNVYYGIANEQYKDYLKPRRIDTDL